MSLGQGGNIPLTRWDTSQYIFAMDIKADLVTDIDAFLAQSGMAETTFGRLAVNDGKFLGRLRTGGNLTISTVDRVRAFLTSHPRRLPYVPDDPDRVRTDAA
jgi:hypothetical protein